MKTLHKLNSSTLFLFLMLAFTAYGNSALNKKNHHQSDCESLSCAHVSNEYDTIDAKSYKTNNGALPQQTYPVIGGRSVLIIRGVDPATHTWDNTDADLAEFETQLDAYIRNSSFNKTWISTFDLTPVYNFTVDPNNKGAGALVSIFESLAANGGYNADTYNVVIYMHQSTIDFGGAGALGYGNGARGGIYANNKTANNYAGLIHETFHAFGMGHAEAIEGNTIPFPGNSLGGVDPYHFMGSSRDAGLLADVPSYFKYRYDWIDAENVVYVPNVTGCVTHRIYRGSMVQNYNASNNYAAQLGDNLWISYEPDNANTNIVKKGLLFHYIPGPNSEITRLLDMNPGSIDDLPLGYSDVYRKVADYWDSALEQGESYYWEGANIEIINTGGTGEEKWADVQFCNCIYVSGDSDSDSICDSEDVCNGGNDILDDDNDFMPNDCDTCPNDPLNDSNNNGICDNVECTGGSLESFNYSPTNNIESVDGGRGFNDSWVASTLNGNISVTAGSLSFNGETGTGNKLEFTAINEGTTKVLSRNLAHSFPNGSEVWISVLVKPLKIGDGGFWIQPNGSQGLAFGKRWGNNIALDNTSNSIFRLTVGQTYRLVARYQLKGIETVMHLWVNPTDNTFTEADAIATRIVGRVEQIESIRIALSRYDDGSYEVDELFIGCDNPVKPASCLGLQGTACNDSNPCTANDKYDANCNCAGIYVDTDNDGICDGVDFCNGLVDVGIPCDDGNICTVNDMYNANCDCIGTFQDSDNDNICDALDVPGACPSVVFDQSQIIPFGGNQDNGIASLLDYDRTILLQNNAWKAIPYNYNITPNTVMSFSFKSTSKGESHVIGLDNDLGITSSRMFKLYGSQNEAGLIQDYAYNGSGNYQDYVIPIGQYYTGQMQYLFFTVDSDSNPTEGDSYFSNVIIFEDTNENGIMDDCGLICDSEKAFPNNPLTHSGTEFSATTLNLQGFNKNVSFTISNIDQRTNGSPNRKYIEEVTVSYVDGEGLTRTHATYSGVNTSSVRVNIPGQVKSVTVSLTDIFDGDVRSSSLNISFSDVTSCYFNEVICADADNDGVCDDSDICPGGDDTIDNDGDGTPDACETDSTCNTCSSVINNLPYTENFELDIESICQVSNDDFDWEVRSGKTPSADTGPENAYEGSSYFFIEASQPNFPTKTAIFQGACYNLSNTNTAKIDFWYHMFGAEMGTLSLDVSTDNGNNWSEVWSLNGDQGNSWKNAVVDLSAYASSIITYRFNAVTGSNYTSDFGLDKITVSTGNAPACTVGTTCDDGDVCTISDTYNTNCDCAGIFQDSDGDGICDANDNNNGGGCTISTFNFAQSSLTHERSGSNSISYNFPDNTSNVAFSILNINQKTKGNASRKYIEQVTVTYVDGDGATLTYGVYSGANNSSINVNITGTVQSVTITLEDILDGSTLSKMTVDLSNITACVSTNGRLGIDAYKTDNIDIVPNPAKNLAQVRFEVNETTEALIELKAANGATLIQREVIAGKGANSTQIDLSNLPTGLYFIKVQAGDMLRSGKVIKAD